jgi:hypothetical protein
MPMKKSTEVEKHSEECILRNGKMNNIIEWQDHMYNLATGLYGTTGMFFKTDVSYVHPFPHERDYNPAYVPPSIAVAAVANAEPAAQHEYDEDDNEAAEAPIVAPAVAPPIIAESLIKKLREGAYEGRRRAQAAQRENEMKLWSLMWTRMSPQSQSKVREDSTFEQACLELDSVQLWILIKRSHLTHVYGDEDTMAVVNIHDQALRYSNMRQMDKELISDFKTRYDHQVKANDGVGMAPISDALRAMDFISKLDQRRYNSMVIHMRNNACQNIPGSYPATLAAAFRVASSWTKDDGTIPLGEDQHSAFIADTTLPVKPKPNREKKSLEDIECFVCGKVGHYARNCNLKKGGIRNEKALVTGDGSISDELQQEVGYQFSDGTILFSQHHVLLDNQASVNIFNNANLLTDIGKSQKTIVLNGVQNDASGVTVSREGTFRNVGRVYYSDRASANILSMSAMVDSGAVVNYNQEANRFTMTPKGTTDIYSFSRMNVPGSEGKFFICDVRTMIGDEPRDHPGHEKAFIQTVSANLIKYTKREVEQAGKARELLARMGYPSVDTALGTLRNGSDFSVSDYDFKIADAIWGRDIASIQGKTTKKATRKADITLGVPIVQKQQILAVDIMYIEQVTCLVGVAYPLDLTFGVTLSSAPNVSSRSAEVVKSAIDTIITTLKSRMFEVRLIMSDGEKAIGKLRQHLNNIGIEVDISGAGGHVSRVERKIQTIKQRVRSHICGRLPFTLNILGLSMLALFCISRLNHEHTGTRPGALTPREAFSGRKTVGSLDYRVAFGDYTQCTVPNTDNSMKPRTEDCIALLPTGNRTGTVKMMSLSTGQVVLRDQFIILPMPQSVINLLNAMAKKDGRTRNHTSAIDLQYMARTNPTNMPSFMAVQPPSQDPNMLADVAHSPVELGGEHAIPRPGQLPTSTAHPNENTTGTIRGDNQNESHSMSESQSDTQNESEIGGDIVSESQSESQNKGEIGDDSHNSEESNNDGEKAAKLKPVRKLIEFFRTGEEGVLLTAPEEKKVTLTTSALESILQHLREEVSDPDANANVSVRNALKTRGKEAREVIDKELQQMLDKRVWTPIMRSDLTEGQRASVIRSSMFLKRKTNPDGSFNKYKARLVAGGDQQDKKLYDDVSSPTVSTSAVFTAIAIAAAENRKVAVVDIGGAFLNAMMPVGMPVFMRLDSTMSDFLTSLDSEYDRYVDNRGCVTVKLDRALYGCIESASLWHKNLTKSMKTLGYIPNECDCCVFNKRNQEGMQCTATVHVDDLFISSEDEQMITELAKGLREIYGEISLAHGPRINYLGLQVNMEVKGEARITMDGYVEEMLASSGVQGTARTPATDGLFETRDTALAVPQNVSVWFHRVVAQMLYLAKRVRPECLTAVAYLATRVTRCDGDDVEKLHRLIRYVRGTKEMGIVLRPGKEGMGVSLYVDASYGVHADGRSHTGACVVIGSVGAVHCRSTKQSILSKSSTEAELIGMSDAANQAIYMRNFLEQQGYNMPPVTIYQDNMSSMALIRRGRSGAERTRHINIRYFWIKERVDMKEVVVVHKGTSDMYANVLTKPLQGSQFVHERECLTGWVSPVCEEE